MKWKTFVYSAKNIKRFSSHPSIIKKISLAAIKKVNYDYKPAALQRTITFSLINL